MKTPIAIICCLLFGLSVSAQETVAETQKLADGNKEVYYVLKANQQIKQGVYQVRHKNKVLVSGMYNQNKKAGMWHYFDAKGNVLQNYDFDKNQLNYEAPDSNSTPNFRYLYDQDLKETDRITKPVRIGGRYYGYFPYIKLVQSMVGSVQTGSLLTVTFEWLVSPGGNLADYKIYLNYLSGQRVLNADITGLKPDDKLFIPATINYAPVSCRIRATCRVINGEVVF